jgi:hypothetical protein
MRKTFAITGLALVLTGSGGGDSPSAPVASAPQATRSSAAAANVDPRRAALANILTCRDRAFLARSREEQRAALVSIEGVACDAASPGAPNRCAILPALKVGGADIAWFVIGAPSEDLTPIVLPAPPEALRNAMPAGSGALSPGTDAGDTTVECAMRDGALAKGAISGTVQRGGDKDSAMRVCAFELAQGMPQCIQTAPGQRAFRLDVQRGDYLVLAIPADQHDTRVGYTECDAPFVGESSDGARNTVARDDDTPCSHELKVVTVRAGETTSGVDPADLRALEDAGDWPQPPPAE